MIRRSLRLGAVVVVSALALAGAVVGSSVRPQTAGAAVSLIPVGRTPTTYVGFHPGIGPPSAFSSPAVGDVVGSSAPEVVTGAMDGCVQITSLSGAVITGCLSVGPAAVQSSPVLADWNGDGRLDIIVASMGGGLFGWRGDGVPLFHFPTNGGLISTPAVGDVDGDGKPDLAVSTLGSEVAVYRHDGSKLFARFIYDTSWSSPALADLDGDGTLEVIVGGDMDIGNGAIGLPGIPAAGGYLWAFHRDGSDSFGFPRFLSSQVIWSSPAVVDFNQDGHLDIVVGTGENWNGLGHALFAVDRYGNALPGWPVAMPEATMGSPAIADLNGDGRLDVAQQTGDGRISYISQTGVVWKQWCNRSPGWGPCMHVNFDGGPSIGDIDADGVQDVVTTTESDLAVFNGVTGALEARVGLPNTWVPGSHPTIVHWGNDTYIVVSATTNANGSTAPDSGDQHVVSVFRTGKGGGVLGWPMFKNNLKRTGTYDDSVPPTVTGSVTAAPAGSTRMLIELTASDAETGVAGVDIEVRQDTDRWVRYLTRSGPTGSAGTTVTPRRSLFGLAGHRYSVRVRGWDRAGNRSPWRVVGSRFLGPAATRSQPFDVAYTASANGTVGGVSSPPVAAPPIPGNLGRGVVAAPGGGGYTLDGFGGLHPFGGAPALRGGAYWPGWDVARGVVLDRTGAGGLVVDAFGGLHPFGAQRAPTSRAGYWPGWDVVRGITLTPDSTLRNPRGYVADAFGGIHPFGGAPKVRNSGYWLGWDIVRGIATDPSGPGGYVLDGFGAVHPFGGAPARAPGQYWAGRDTARGIALISGGSAGRGYVLEGTGRVVPFGGAPAVQTVVRWPAVGSRGLAIAP